jgi:hypothetical protein
MVIAKIHFMLFSSEEETKIWFDYVIFDFAKRMQRSSQMSSIHLRK